VSGLGEVSGGLDPAEALLDAFSQTLADGIARMAVRRGLPLTRTLPSMAMCGVMFRALRSPTKAATS
jgi:hypothetical protein